MIRQFRIAAEVSQSCDPGKLPSCFPSATRLLRRFDVGGPTGVKLSQEPHRS